MSSKAEIISRLTDPGIIAIVRALRTEQVIPLSEALLTGGITAIEITLTTPNAFEAIRAANRHFGERAFIGVGTVLTPYECQQALDAGAQFVVTPICRTQFVALAHHANKPIMLGAYTPTEAQLAHEAGADFVKLFPADGLGPAFVKALRAPLPHLRLVPTGGVDLQTIGEFFKAGCPAVGAGSALITRNILQSDDWAGLAKRAGEFVAAATAGRVSS